MGEKIESFLKARRKRMIFCRDWSTDPKKLDFGTDLGVLLGDNDTLCFRDANGFDSGYIERKDVPALIDALQKWVQHMNLSH